MQLASRSLVQQEKGLEWEWRSVLSLKNKWDQISASAKHSPATTRPFLMFPLAHSLVNSTCSPKVWRNLAVFF